MDIASHRPGRQRPGRVWCPSLRSVTEENPDSDGACAAFSLGRESFSQTFVCPSLSHQNDEMHRTMTVSISSPRNIPRPGLVRALEQGGFPSYHRTSMPGMPCEEAPRILGDMSFTPGTRLVATFNLVENATSMPHQGTNS